MTEQKTNRTEEQLEQEREIPRHVGYDELPRRREQLRMLHEIIPERREDKRKRENDEAEQAQVGSRDGREIEIVRLLQKIEDRRRQDHHLRRRVA